MKFLALLNKATSPFSMYKGIAMGLLGVWAAALALAFFNLTGFSPLALVVSTVVLLVAVQFTSFLCAKLFGLTTHYDSSLITALILSLIFLPTLEVGGLVVLAFVGMIAGASKYILTWRGRHVFNPAAIAAVVIGITGLGGASWWVATPLLTPVVAIVALVSLYQTKQFWVAGIFLAITIPVLVIQFLLFGATFGESLVLLMSWPLIFLAGVMLTEPLTLPPRAWQRYIVAVVVAVAFLLPFKIGPVQMTPALALVIGNIVAAVFAARYAITLTFKERRSLTPTTDELVFESNVPTRFLPGQYMELQLDHKKADFRGARRSFSLTSLPGSKEVTFGVKFYEPSSSFKKALRALESGDQVGSVQVSGDFVLPKDASKPLLLVAGGIGITPFISQLKALRDERDIVLVHTVSSPEEFSYKDILDKSGVKVITLASRINYEELAQLVPDMANRWAYVSGPTPFVQEAKSKLRHNGIRGVKSDYFVGY